MKKSKFITIILALVLALSSFSGCAPKTNEIPSKEIQQPEKNQELSDKIKIIDQIGREVTLESPAKRIVSSYYISTAILISLGVSDKLVGIEAKADTRQLYERTNPDIISLPAVGSGKGINIEETAALSPDVVIIPQKLKDAVSSFEELNIPVIVVDPETMDNFKDCVSMLGIVTDAEKNAEELLSYYDEKTDMIKSLTENITQKPSVYLSSGTSYFSTCTSKMYQNELIKIAGGENVSEELTEGYWQTISAEQLNLWAPEYFFAVSYASYGLDDIKNDTTLTEIPALKEGNVFSFPSAIEPWDYPTPSSILGLLYLTHTLHPELFGEEAYIEEATSFYNKFFKISVTKEDLGL